MQNPDEAIEQYQLAKKDRARLERMRHIGRHMPGPLTCDDGTRWHPSEILALVGDVERLRDVRSQDWRNETTTEQQRKMLEAAAKACGFKKWRVLTSGLFQVSNNENWNEAFAKWTGWNPFTNPADTAEMCAELGIDWDNYDTFVRCSTFAFEVTANLKDHDNSRLNAWQHAATMVAAKIGGYEE